LTNKSLFDALSGVLKSLNDNNTYRSKPPEGPPTNWPAIKTEDSFQELNYNTFGEDPIVMAPYDRNSLMLIEDDGIFPRDVTFPTTEILEDINICAIDGSNERIEREAFYFILVRAALVNFRYSKAGLRPYSYQEMKDLTAVTIADQNIFNRDKLQITTSYNINEDEKEIRNYISGYLRKPEKEPIFIEYNRERNVLNPASHALGWAVKLMQTLELICLRDVKKEGKTVCIKDGPIFSPSVSREDTKQLLRTIKSWNNQILVGCSKRISDSRLLVQLLAQKKNLRHEWFPDADLKDSTVKAITSDSIILSRHLRPGQRTALIQGISTTRKNIITDDNDEADLMPLNCYYLSKSRPHSYIRLEIPKMFYTKNPSQVEEAIRIVAWQHELGKTAPLIQLLADKRCSLSSEKEIIERVTDAALKEKQLEFLHVY
jgi:hypothetical protein